MQHRYNYKFFQKQNDTLKKHTPSEIVGHLEDIDYEKGTLNLVVNGNKTARTIEEVVEAINSQAGCVSNPSAIEDWVGFKELKDAAESKKQRIGVMTGKNEFGVQNFTLMFRVPQRGVLYYTMGDMQRRIAVWKNSKKLKYEAALECEFTAINSYLRENGVDQLTVEEQKLILSRLGINV